MNYFEADEQIRRTFNYLKYKCRLARARVVGSVYGQQQGCAPFDCHPSKVVVPRDADVGGDDHAMDNARGWSQLATISEPHSGTKRLVRHTVSPLARTPH